MRNDLTERKRAEEAIRPELRYRTLFDLDSGGCLYVRCGRLSFKSSTNARWNCGGMNRKKQRSERGNFAARSRYFSRTAA